MKYLLAGLAASAAILFVTPVFAADADITGKSDSTIAPAPTPPPEVNPNPPSKLPRCKVSGGGGGHRHHGVHRVCFRWVKIKTHCHIGR